MNPNHIENMNQPDDAIDALLREQNPRIDDNGFTARVIKNLPRRRRRPWWRPAILLTTTGVGSILAGMWLPWKNLAVPVSLDALLSDPQVLMAWGATWALIAALSWGAVSSLAFAHGPENQTDDLPL